MLRIISLNLNGIRSATKKGWLDWLAKQQADVLCVQELKAQAADMSPEMLNPHGLYGTFHYAEKKGYSGVGVYSRQSSQVQQIGFDGGEFDAEGRYVEVDFGHYVVVSVYLPSGSSSEERQQAKFRFLDVFFPHLKSLKARDKEIVICGDLNIAHQEIDLKNWKGNLKNSGFLPEERAWMTQVLTELGFVDVYRQLYPNHEGEAYTWWSNRGQAWANNVGWRIDYQLATPGIAQTAKQGRVYKDERFSDHAPLIIDYDFK